MAALLLVGGCSQKFNDVNDTVKLAFFGDPDAVIDTTSINNMPYASLYARVDDGPQAFMVLALAEPTSQIPPDTPSPLQLKWLSADKGMLVTQAGRLVKSLNLPQGNLLSLTGYPNNNAQPDPLSLGLHLASTPLIWQSQRDWQPGYHFGYRAQSTFIPQGKQEITVNEVARNSLYFIEEVHFKALDTRYRNEFWIDPDTGRVLKSRQKPAPGLPHIELTVLKPFSA